MTGPIGSTTSSSTPRPYRVPSSTAAFSWSYLAIRWLFRAVLTVFYSNIYKEGVEHLTSDGTPAILLANHSNSLTDALLLTASVPYKTRKLLRLTAKDTQFGRGTFTSWLIESAGTLPIQRPKDHLGRPVDNSTVFAKLISSLFRGDMICMFPEGLSVYRPSVSPLRQGVARILSETLSQKKGDEEFEIAVQTCSITYLHRNLFRSDVLVTFHPPIMVSARTHPGLISTPSAPASETAVRQLTTQIGDTIRSGILDAPSWSYIRAAHTARRLYAPLGTKLGLGEHVRLTQRFVEGLRGRRAEMEWDDLNKGESLKDARGVLKTPMRPEVRGEGDYFGGEDSKRQEELDTLLKDLNVYQDLLVLYGIKDDRVRNPRLLHRRTLLKRLFVRIVGALGLLLISLPGLVFWTPILIVAKRQSDKQKKSGPVFDTYDEVAQTKLVYGLLTGLALWAIFILFTLPILPLSFFLYPLLLWITLRWLEDLTSSLRASLALFRLLSLGKTQLLLLREMRDGLRERVEELAVRDCGLPREPEKYLVNVDQRWKSALSAGFFSLRRRRKKDWNEALTFSLSDVSEYPEDDEAATSAGAAATAPATSTATQA